MREFQLDELTIEEAQGLLTGLCRSENMQMSAEIDYTLKKLHWNIPYFIQVLFSKLADEFDQEITKDSIISPMMSFALKTTLVLGLNVCLSMEITRFLPVRY